MKLDVEYKEDKISSLGREVADLENRGADQEEVWSSFIITLTPAQQTTWNQVTRLKKQKQELENRLREQEEELDDLAGQVCLQKRMMMLILMKVWMAWLSPHFVFI